jgi:hypothetical protein
MRVYFACSITGGRRNEAVYQAMVAALEAAGHDVPTAVLAKPEVMDLEVVVEPEEVYTRDFGWLKSSQALVAEVSTPSHGVGYEICSGLEMGIPVLCCYRQGETVSKMILGNTSPNLQVKKYKNKEEAVKIVEGFLQGLG